MVVLHDSRLAEVYEAVPAEDVNVVSNKYTGLLSRAPAWMAEVLERNGYIQRKQDAPEFDPEQYKSPCADC